MKECILIQIILSGYRLSDPFFDMLIKSMTSKFKDRALNQNSGNNLHGNANLSVGTINFDDFIFIGVKLQVLLKKDFFPNFTFLYCFSFHTASINGFYYYFFVIIFKIK